jgi:hypothetical protein
MFKGWLVGPEVPEGMVYEVTARCDDWIAVGRRTAGGAWLPAGTPGVEYYYLTCLWEPSGGRYKFSFYFPVEGEVDRIIYGVDTHYDRFPVAMPVLSVTAGGRRSDLAPKSLKGYGTSVSGCELFFEVVLPEPVSRDEIKALSFAVGPARRRVSFTLDPRAAWAEYDAGR